MKQNKLHYTPEIVYASDVTESTLPVRSAAAIVIYNEERKILLAKRSQFVGEFKGVWSLPSKFIPEKVNENQTAKILSQSLQEWFSIPLDETALVGRRMALRKEWRLLMHLFKTQINFTPKLSTDKYEDLKWVDGTTFFSQYNYDTLGDCAKAYLHYKKADF